METAMLPLAAGRFSMGQIIVVSQATGYELRHRSEAEVAPEELDVYLDSEDAAQLALYDDAGGYRPLKSAPNLRRGWRLVVPDARALRLALDLFYPARLRAWQVFEEGHLATTSLRETLARQTGMYRVTQKLSAEQADVLVGRFCCSEDACLRTILWKRDVDGTVPSTSLPPRKYDPTYDQTGANGAGCVPLLCQEACNLLVAAARAVVKGETSAAPVG